MEQVKLNQSNPRLAESSFVDLHLEETEGDNISPQSSPVPGHSAVPHSTPTQAEMTLPSADEPCLEEDLFSASILLSDLYSMGFIHPDVMQTCILYIINNICLTNDVRCLHLIFNRGATHNAPSLGSVFLQTCRRRIMLATSAMLEGEAAVSPLFMMYSYAVSYFSR